MHSSIRRAPRITRAVLVLTWGGLAGACAYDVDAPTRPLTRAPSLAIGDVITVTTAADGPNLTGSLRWALKQATGGETIRFAPELAGATITLDSTLVVWKPQLTIEGPADKGITIDGGGNGRVIAVNTYDGMGATLTTMRNLSITGGARPPGDAKGISIGSPLVLEHVTLYGNDGLGPVLYQSGYWDSYLTLINSTVTGNTGGNTRAVMTSGNLTLINSTIADNGGEGGVFTGAGSKLTLRNSIIVRNGGKSCEVGIATVYAEGKNIADDTSCGDASVTMVADPKLEPLAMNGGPAMTRAIARTSPAANAGQDCTVDVDQRYQPRDAKCDIGAYEVQPTAVVLTIDGTSTVNPKTGSAVVSGTIRCSTEETVKLAISLSQEQRARRVPALVQAAGTTSTACSPTTRPWSIAIAPTNSAFTIGDATATAKTVDTPEWVAPSAVTGAMTLYWARK